jgi:hypothetical protein
MKKKHSNKNKFFLTAFSIMVLGVGYLYFVNELRTGDILPVAQGSLSSSATAAENQTANTSSTLSSKITSDISFLSTLNSLKSIRIDTTFFKNTLFTKLKSNSVSIGTATPGRINPFAPIDESAVARNVITEFVSTGQATQISDKSAVLNGSLAVTTGVTETYFEYGETESLGGLTSVVRQQSMVGTFVKSISDLKSKTVYFYKACAKINGSSTCGDIVSFATN